MLERGVLQFPPQLEASEEGLRGTDAERLSKAARREDALRPRPFPNYVICDHFEYTIFCFATWPRPELCVPDVFLLNYFFCNIFF